MSSRNVYRLSGLALLLGSLLVLVFTIMLLVVLPSQGTSSLYTHPLWQPILVMLGLGLLLIVGGLPGMYARQAKQVGWPGRIGFALTGLAMLLFGAFFVIFAFVIPSLDMHTQLLLTGYNDLNLNNGRLPPLVVLSQVAALVLSIGAFLLGRATMHAGVLPRSASIALLIAVPAGLLICLFPLASLSQPLVWSALGELLWVVSMIAVPVGLLAYFFGLATCGYALLSRRKVEEVAAHLAQTSAKS